MAAFRRQTRARLDTWSGGARAVAVGAQSAHRSDRRPHQQKQARLARARAVVHHRLSRCLIVRSLGLVPQVALPPITQIAATLTTIAMAALGLGVDISVVAKSGVRVTLAVTASLIVLGSISYALIRVAGIP